MVNKPMNQCTAQGELLQDLYPVCEYLHWKEGSGSSGHRSRTTVPSPLSAGIIKMEMSFWRDLSALDSTGVMLGGGSFGLHIMVIQLTFAHK